MENNVLTCLSGSGILFPSSVKCSDYCDKAEKKAYQNPYLKQMLAVLYSKGSVLLLRRAEQSRMNDEGTTQPLI